MGVVLEREKGSFGWEGERGESMKTKPRAACVSLSLSHTQSPDFVPMAIRYNLSGGTKRCHSLYEKASLAA